MIWLEVHSLLKVTQVAWSIFQTDRFFICLEWGFLTPRTTPYHHTSLRITKNFVWELEQTNLQQWVCFEHVNSVQISHLCTIMRIVTWPTYMFDGVSLQCTKDKNNHYETQLHREIVLLKSLPLMFRSEFYRTLADVFVSRFCAWRLCAGDEISKFIFNNEFHMHLNK